MKDIAYYNGKIGRIDEVQAPITDRGLYFGDGVYDAAMVRNKKIFALDDHLDRFYNSLRLLRIEPPMERSELAATLNDLVSRLDSDAPHMLYWQSTRAAAHRKHAFPAGAKATLMAFAEACPLDRHDHPYKLITVEDTRFLHCNIKTLNLLPAVMSSQAAKREGVQETVFYRAEMGNRVTECAHSNVSIILNDELWTAPTDNLILPGIARKHLIKAANKLGIPVHEEPYDLDTLRGAQEIIVTSSSNLCLFAEEFEGKPCGGGSPEVAEALRAEVNREFAEATTL